MADDLEDLDKLLADVEELETKQTGPAHTAGDLDLDDATETSPPSSTPPSSAGSKIDKRESSSQPNSAGVQGNDDWEENKTLLDRLNAVQAQGAEMAALLKTEDSLADDDDGGGDDDFELEQDEVEQHAAPEAVKPHPPAADGDLDTLLNEVDNLVKKQEEDKDDEDEYGDDFEASDQELDADADQISATDQDLGDLPAERNLETANNGENEVQQQHPEEDEGGERDVDNSAPGSEPDQAGSSGAAMNHKQFQDSKEPDSKNQMVTEQNQNNVHESQDREEEVAGEDEGGYEDEDFEEDGAGYDDDDFENEGGGEDEAARDKHDAPEEQSAPAKPPPLTTMEQLDQFQSDWMRNGSRQQRIYKYAVRELAMSLVVDILDAAIEEAEERRIKEETLTATILKEQFAGYKQLRECDYAREEKKRMRMEAQRKLQLERSRREEEDRKRVRERLRKERELAATKDSELSASLARVREKRQKEKRFMDAMKLKEVQFQRDRIERNRQRAEEKRAELQEFIRVKKEEEQRVMEEEEKATQKREVLRSVQQEAAFQSMEDYALEKQAARSKQLARAREEWALIKHAHHQFEDSLRQCQQRVSHLRKPRADKRSSKSHTYRKKLPPRHPSAPGESGANYSASMQFSVSAYCSPAGEGGMHPTALKRAREMLTEPLGGRPRKTFSAGQAIVFLQHAFERVERWRAGQVSASDLCAALQKLGADVGREHMGRIIAEFGVEAEDVLSMEDFVEVGLAVVTMAAPYQLVPERPAASASRSKSAEPRRGPSTSGMLPEAAGAERTRGGRQTMSAMDMRNDALDFPEQDLQLHLQHAVKGRLAREREVALLREEALSIMNLRKRHQTGQSAPPADAQPLSGSAEPAAAAAAAEAAEQPEAASAGSELAQGDAHRAEEAEGQEQEQEAARAPVATWGAEEAAPAFGGPSASKPTASAPFSKPSRTSPFAFKKPAASKPPTEPATLAAPASSASDPAAPPQPPAPSAGEASAQPPRAGEPHAAAADAAGGAEASAGTGDGAQPTPAMAGRAERAGSRRGARRGSSGLPPRAGTPGSRPLTRQDSSRPSSRQTPFHGDLETETLDKTTAPAPAAPAAVAAADSPASAAPRASKPFKFKMPAAAGRRAQDDAAEAQPAPAQPPAAEEPTAPAAGRRADADAAGEGGGAAALAGEGGAEEQAGGEGGHGAGGEQGGRQSATPPQEAPVPVAVKSNFPMRPKGRNRPF